MSPTVAPQPPRTQALTRTHARTHTRTHARMHARTHTSTQRGPMLTPEAPEQPRQQLEPERGNKTKKPYQNPGPARRSSQGPPQHQGPHYSQTFRRAPAHSNSTESNAKTPACAPNSDNENLQKQMIIPRGSPGVTENVPTIPERRPPALAAYFTDTAPEQGAPVGDSKQQKRSRRGSQEGKQALRGHGA